MSAADYEVATVELGATMPGLIAALARAQANFPPIVKSKENPHYKSQFADVADVLAAVRPVLAAEGIAITQSTVITEYGGVALCTALRLGDESEESIFPLLVDGLTAQQVGSLLTYHRRYQLCALLGVHPVGDDDDGNLVATAAPSRDSHGIKVSDFSAPRVSGDPYALAAANPPEKPLAAMTAGEMARYGESIGVRVSGNKSDILRTLQPYVLAATGEEPFGTWVREPEGDASGMSHPAEPEPKPFEPVVAPPADDLRTLPPDVRASIRRGEK